jgi:hypothetical protein
LKNRKPVAVVYDDDGSQEHRIVDHSNHKQLVGDDITLKIENPDHSTEELPSSKEHPETEWVRFWEGMAST